MPSSKDFGNGSNTQTQAPRAQRKRGEEPVIAPRRAQKTPRYQYLRQPKGIFYNSFQPCSVGISTTEHVYSDGFFRHQEQLDPEWLFRRAPKDGTYKLTKGSLQLCASPEVLAERVACSFLGIRQRQSEFDFSAQMSFKGTAEAGVAIASWRI